MKPEQGRFEGGVHLLPLRVYVGDTDAGGMVYHATYLNFFERGRSEFLRSLELDHSALISPQGEAMVFAVARMSIVYKAQAKVDDALVVHTRLERLRAASFETRQWISRQGNGGNEIITEAEVIVAIVDGKGRPQRIPAAFRESLNRLDSAA